MGRIYKAWNEKTQQMEDIKTWDGTCERFPGMKYADHKSLYIGGDGVIWYFSHGCNTPSIWCGANELGTHLYRLNQILDGRAMVNI